MARSRCMLSVTHLERFSAFCESLGWVKEEPKGDYEVLRMRRKGDKEPLIVHGRLMTQQMNDLAHYTVWGESYRMCVAYLKSKKVKK